MPQKFSEKISIKFISGKHDSIQLLLETKYSKLIVRHIVLVNKINNIVQDLIFVNAFISWLNENFKMHFREKIIAI